MMERVSEVMKAWSTGCGLVRERGVSDSTCSVSSVSVLLVVLAALPAPAEFDMCG